MKKVVLFAAFLAIQCLNAQVPDILPAGTSIANTQTARTDIWCAFGNPAGMIQSDRFQFAFQYENKYLLAELSTATAQAAYCNPYLNVGICYSYFGYSKYNEMLAGISLAHDFGGKFSLGIQGNYYAAYCGDDIGYRGTFLPQIGMTAHLGKNFTLGFHTFNPFQQKLKGELAEKRLPSLFCLGSDYRFAKDFRWLVQIDREVSSSFRFATGFEWQAIEQLCIKLGGYGYQYFVGCLGFELKFGDFRFDINCELHPLLGLNMLGKVGYAIK